MTNQGKLGRPKVSSRETLSEAALELFLERGYVATSVTDITMRAGVSRSSFFNYFAAKSDVIWSSFDERITLLHAALAQADGESATADVETALLEMVESFAPDALALALSNAAAMGAEDELEREGAARAAHIAGAINARLQRGGVPEVTADVLAAAYSGGVIGAVKRWARDGSGKSPLGEYVAQPLALIAQLAA